MLDPVPGWVPTHNEFARLQQGPKHQLADPALAARLLGVTGDSLLRPRDSASGALTGQLFEALVTLCVRVGAQAAEAEVFHLRTRNGDHEVDLVVQGDDRRILALEVKLSSSVDDPDVRHLRWLRERVGDRLTNVVVVATGRHAYRRRDGMAVVPLALLGA